jgi:hypothetical protein
VLPHLSLKVALFQGEWMSLSTPPYLPETCRCRAADGRRSDAERDEGWGETEAVSPGVVEGIKDKAAPNESGAKVGGRLRQLSLSLTPSSQS